MTKKRVLWVVYDFVQAGGQKYVYEICKALNKDKYQIDILRVSELNQDKNWNNEFYLQPTIDLGCAIFKYFDIIRIKEESYFGKLALRVENFVRAKTGLTKDNRKAIETEQKQKLESFFANYDVINFSGIGVYEICLRFNIHLKNSFIHILTFGFQHSNMYSSYNVNLHYDFISPVTEEAARRDLKDFTDYRFTYFPLAFETNPYDITWRQGQQKFVIAIFTRLSLMKPLDPFFYTLKILTEQGYDIELHLYGAGDPDELRITNQLRYLYIADRVKFKGHVSSIPDALRQNPPDLLWFQSANQEPGGYAAFEISMSGLPQLFWDFMDTGMKRDISKVFPSFTEILSFASYTANMLNDVNSRKELGSKQRNYVLEKYSIQEHIHIIEELFDRK